MKLKKSRAAKPIPQQPVVLVDPTAVLGVAFNTERVVKLLTKTCLSRDGEKALTLSVSTTWLREALNTTCLEFFVNFAVSQSDGPAKQAEWVKDLETACRTLLQMLAPNSRGAGPPVADHRVHSILLNLEGSRVDLDAVARNVWDLRAAAQFARERWNSATGQRPPRASEKIKDVEISRHYATDRPVRTWIAAVAYLYERAFDERAPLPPPDGGRFTRFAEGVRQVAMQPAPNTSYGTDEAARARLKELTPMRLRRYIRDNAADFAERVEILRKKDFQPRSLALKILPDLFP
jgi:hypothetical protein